MQTDTGTLNTTSSNFGAKGWLMIIYAGILLFFHSGTCTDGLNVIVNNFAQAHNLDSNQILSLTTPASWAGLIGSVLWAWFVDKNGCRLGALVTGVLGGICYMLYGVVSTTSGFFVVTALVNFMGFGYAHTVANALIANWFPIKKGLAMGWSTMGQNIATAIFVPLLMLFLRFTNLSGSFYIMGAILALAGVAGWFLVRNTPEEWDATPDNGAFSKEQLEHSLREIREYQSPWTPKKLLANKQIWLIGIGYGIYILVTASLISK